MVHFRVKATKETLTDLLNGAAPYVKPCRRKTDSTSGVILADTLTVSKDKLVFSKGLKPVAELQFATVIGRKILWDAGETLTISLGGVSIDFSLE